MDIELCGPAELTYTITNLNVNSLGFLPTKSCYLQIVIFISNP